MSSAPAPSGPFRRGSCRFDEAERRRRSSAAATRRRASTKLVAGEARVVALHGAAGVGKTSLLRAGLAPALGRAGGSAVYARQLRRSGRELVRATSRLGIDAAGRRARTRPTTWAASRARSRGGLVLILDHLEEALGDEADRGRRVVALIAQRRRGGRRRGCASCCPSTRRRSRASSQLRVALPAAARRARLDDAARGSTRHRSQTSSSGARVQSGTPSRPGWPAAVAGDLCRDGPCRAIDLQLTARAIVDLRLASAAPLPPRAAARGGADWSCLPSACARRRAGAGAAARCVAAGDAGQRRRGDAGGARRHRCAIWARRWRRCGRAACSRAPRTGERRGCSRWRTRRLRAARRGVRASTIARRAAAARRSLRRRVTPGQRLTHARARRRHRNLRGALAPDERRRSSRAACGGTALRIGGGVALALVRVAVRSSWTLRRSYTLALDPPGGGAAARVVVRLGRPTSVFPLLPTARAWATSSPTPVLGGEPGRRDRGRATGRRGTLARDGRRRALPAAGAGGQQRRPAARRPARRRRARFPLAARGAQRPAPGAARDRQGAARRSRRRRRAQARVQRSRSRGARRWRRWR